jgi:DNA uptake protein ComE-like DNA-binding protein
MPRILQVAGVGLALSLIVTGCSGTAAVESSSSSPPAATAETTPANTPTAVPGNASGETGTRLNVNTATVEELQAAFAAAGISNADRWAREVAEYRPYPADPTWAQLRQELGKYNIDPAVLEQIIALLEV